MSMEEKKYVENFWLLTWSPYLYELNHQSHLTRETPGRAL